MPKQNQTDEDLLRVVEIVSGAVLEDHQLAVQGGGNMYIKHGRHTGEPSTCNHDDCRLARNLRLTLRTSL